RAVLVVVHVPHAPLPPGRTHGGQAPGRRARLSVSFGDRGARPGRKLRGAAARLRRRRVTMIIDVHGHYTTAPKALEAWRLRQIEGIRHPAQMPRASELRISEDDVRESI